MVLGHAFFYFVVLSFSFLLSTHAKNMWNLFHRYRNVPGVLVENNYDYKTRYIKQRVDHFNFFNEDQYTMRYLYADQHWKKGGPIFFYTGNEGDIEMFCNNTGFMWDLAPDFNALLIFAEHRYYGQSMPYGASSLKDPAHRGYLTSEQALADFAYLIHYLKAVLPGAGSSPVVAFGGSYGGMLSTWFRIKYPYAIIGALAASAPIWQFTGLTPCGVYNQIVTQDFAKSSPGCDKAVRESWSVITDMGQSDAGRSFLTRTLKLCKKLNTTADVTDVKTWLVNTYGNVAMVDYPYPAGFLEPLPAWPIKIFQKMCEYLSVIQTGKDLIRGVSKAVQVYYNYTGTSKCFDTSETATASLDDAGWDFQACTEMVMPGCSDGVSDMFEPDKWDYIAFAKKCQKKYGVLPRPNWIELVYGGRNITTATNIIFSNGELDPWHGGGVLKSLSESLVAIEVPGGAHHLDLRGKNKNDPPSLTAVREQEKSIIGKWLDEYYSTR